MTKQLRRAACPESLDTVSRLTARDLAWCAFLAIAALTLFFVAKSRVLPWAQGPLTFDAQYYMSIYEHGYVFDGNIENKQNTAFLPLTAFVIGISAQLVPGSYSLMEVAALGAVVLFGTLVALFLLASEHSGRRAGMLATLLWAGSPVAMYNFVGYSEPLFALLCAWAIVAIQRDRVWMAVILAATALLGRPQAVVLAVFVAIMIVQRAGWRPRALLAGPGVVQLCLMVAPLMAFATWQAIALGDAAIYINSLEAWRRGSFMDANLGAGPAFLHLFDAVSAEAKTLSHWSTLLAVLSVSTVLTALMLAPAVSRRIALFYMGLLAFLLGSASFDALNVARHVFFMFPWVLIFASAIAQLRGDKWQAAVGLCGFLFMSAVVNAHAVMRYYRGEWVS